MSGSISVEHSQLASNPSAKMDERTTVHRLLDFADIIFSKIIPKKRQRGTPASDTMVQRRETADVEVAGLSPGTPLPQRPHTTPQTTTHSTKKQVLVSDTFLRQVAQALHSHSEIELAESRHRQSSHKLSALKRRLDYLQLRTKQMKEFLIDEGPRLVREHADPELQSKLIDEEIAQYNSQFSDFCSGIEDVDKQAAQLSSTLERILEERENLQEAVDAELRKLLEVDALPSHLPDDLFTTTQPIDDKALESYRKNCEEFEQNVLFDRFPEEETDKYPRRPTADWPIHFEEMKLKRQELDDVLSKLAHLTSTGATGSELETCTERATTARHALKEAVEAVRFAGVTCNSNGSLPMFDYGSESEAAEQAEPEPEMTEDEIKQYLANTYRKTQNWLADSSSGRDPESAGPLSPNSPGAANFRDRLGSVDFGDSISEVLRRVQREA